jgi:hypothetical protein
MSRSALLLLAGLAFCRAEPAPETVLRETAVPNRLLRQGDVRLLQRGGALVVQTRLHSAHLPKVLKKITAAELNNWPEDHARAADRRAYLDALEEAGAHAREQADAQGRATLRIEFVSDADGARIRLESPDADPNQAARAWTPTASPDYVRRNMVLILQDAFGKDEAEVLAWLAPHGWEATP